MSRRGLGRQGTRAPVRAGALLLVILVLWGGVSPAFAADHGSLMRASWYGREQQGHLMADGGRYDMDALTAAHRTLPLGTLLRVRNPRNGKAVRVVVTDRGPYARGRDLDLSYAAARDLGILRQGTAVVSVTRLGRDPAHAKAAKRPRS